MVISDDFPVTIGEPFQFEWWVDQDGYRVEYEPPVTTGAMLMRHDGRHVLRRNGGPFRAYRPLEEAPGMFLELANTPRTLEAVRAFADRYGLLGTLFKEAQQMDHELVEGEWFQLMDLLGGMVWTLQDLLSQEKPLADLARTFNAHVRPAVTIRLGTGPTPHHKPTLEVVPRTLRGAIWLQFASQITRGTRFKQCKWCSTWFPFGPGTQNRSTKEFCSDRCRQALHRQQLKETSQ